MRKINENNTSFDYKPTGSEGLQSRISYTVKNERGENKELSQDQKDLIKNFINTEIRMDPAKDHAMQITVLKEDQFSIVIDNKTTFFISKKTGEQAEKIAAVQDLFIKKKLFPSVFKDFVQFILSFFYTPSFPNLLLKKRGHKEAIKEDYRALRKSLEMGNAWLVGDEKIHLTSSQHQERKKLKKEVNSSIFYAKKIEKALQKRNPKRELKNFAIQLASEMDLLMGNKQSRVIPVGFRTQEGVFQPVMLRFYKDDRGELYVEFFCDTAEGSAKIAPTQLRKFAPEKRQKAIESALNIAFAPLLSENEEREKLLKAAKQSPAWGSVYASIEASKKEELFGSKNKKAEKDIQPPPKEKGDPYESLMRSLDKEIGVSWSDQTSPIDQQRLIKQPKTPAARVVKWFDRLIGQHENRFTQNEKLNLLFFLTNDWVDDQMKQLKRSKAPLSTKLTVYRQCLQQITHVKEKIAVALNDDHPLDVAGIPKSLQEKEKICQLAIRKLEAKRQRQAAELRRPFLRAKHETDLRLPVAAPTFKSEKTAAAMAPAKAIDQLEWENAFALNLDELEKILEPTELQQHHAAFAMKQFDTTKKFLVKVYQRQFDEEVEADQKREIQEKIDWLNDYSIIDQLFPNGAFNEEALSVLIDKLLIPSSYTGEDYQIYIGKGEGASETFVVDPQELAAAVKQLILSPHLLPSYYYSQPNKGPAKLFQLLRAVQDPNTSISSDSVEMTACLRSLLSLRHLVPKKILKESIENSRKIQEATCEQSLEKLLRDKKMHYRQQLKAYQDNQLFADNPEYQSILTSNENMYNEMISIIETLEKSKDSLDDMITVLENKREETQKQIENMRDSHQESLLIELLGKKIQEISELAKLLEQKEKYLTFLRNAEFNKIPVEPSHENIDIRKAAEGTDAFQRELTEQVNTLTKQIEQLRKAAETDPSNKKILLLKTKQHAFQLLKKLPPPGTEGAFGTPSIWYILTKDQRETFLETIHTLEHLIWESQMKCAETEMDGKERFLLIKAQAIRWAMIRAELNEIEVPADHEWEYITDNASLDQCTMDVFLANQLLSQDLTTCLSENADMEQDLLAVYHFVIRDHNQGASDQIASQERPQRQPTTNWQDLKNGYQRKDEKILPLLEQMEKADLYYRTASDPNFTLYSCEGPAKGVPFFQAKPDTLLKQAQLDLTIDDEGGIFIVDVNEKIPLAEVHVNGHPDFAYLPDHADMYTEEEKALRIRKKQPFLPTVDHEKTAEEGNIPDLRTLKGFDVWMSYVTEKAQEEPLAIPPQVLQELFLIRQTPLGNKYVRRSTSYDSDTAIRALSFLSNKNFQAYLEHDFVQQYLKESLFGSFLLQQAIVEHPELLLSQLSLLRERLDEAKQSDNHTRIGFFSSVIQQLQSHAHFTQQSLQNQGWFSGLINGSLPAHLSREGGLFHKIFKYIEEHRKTEDHTAFGSHQDCVDADLVLQPLTSLMKKIDACAEELEDLKKLSVSSFVEPLLDGKNGERPIDKITNPHVSRQVYTHLLQTFRWEQRTTPPPRLTTENLQEILTGYRLLCDVAREEGIPADSLINWVREDILPAFHRLEQHDKNHILNALANQKGDWMLVDKTSDTYQLRLADRDVIIDLYTMTSSEGETSSRRAVQLPDSIAKRADVQQAFNHARILAAKTRAKGKEIYTWESEGQAFSLTVSGKQVTITRDIHAGDFAGKYTFQPFEIGDVVNQSQTLLAENGMWRREGEPNGYIFTQGINLPTKPFTYSAQIERNTVAAIRSADENSYFVSCSPSSQQLLPFAKTKDVIVLLNPRDKKPVELRLKNAPIVLKKEEKNWVCYHANKRIGTIDVPKQHVLQLTEMFGSQWDQYVIPVKNGHERVFVLLPYEQKKEGREAVSIVSSTLPKPEILTLTEEGTLEGSINSHLYLAHTFLLQAAQSKSSTEGRKLSLQALHHLQRVSQERPSSDPSELESLKHVIHLIKQHPTVSLEAMPSPVDLSLSLKMLLTIRRLRSVAANALPLSPRDHVEELENLTKMYDAYCRMKQTQAFAMFRAPAREKQLHKALFLLQESEEAELIGIAQQVLQTIQHGIKEESMRYFLGATGRPVPTLEMPAADHLDPQFLLALIRSAKPASEAIDIRTITSPLPLYTLLENFWSYFLSIQEHSIKPEELTFLFEKSLFPQSISSEQEEHLKVLDAQARQFLLTAAYMQQMVPSNPMKSAKEKVEEAKKSIDLLTSPDNPFGSLISRTPLKPSFDAIAKSVQELRVHSKEEQQQVRGKALDIPDVDKLLREVKGIETQIINFVDGIEDLVKRGEDFAKTCREKDEKLRQDLDRLKSFKTDLEEQHNHALQQADTDEKRAELAQEYAHKIEEMDREINKQAEDREKFLAEEQKDPVSGELIPNRLVAASLHGHAYEAAVKLQELKDAAKMAGGFLQELQQNLDVINRQRQYLDVWVKMQAIYGKLTEPFNPSPWFHLSDKDKNSLETVNQLIMNLLKGEKFDFEKLSIREKGRIFNDFRKVLGMRGVYNLAQEQESFTDKLIQFSSALLPLTLFSNQSANENTRITVEPQEESGIERPLELREITNHPFAKKCFTPEQIEKLQENFYKMDPERQRGLIDRLATALDQNAAIIAAQTGLAQQMQHINEVFTNILAEKQGKDLLPLPTIPEKTTGKRYKTFFEERAGLPKDLEELGQALDACDNGKGLVFLKGELNALCSRLSGLLERKVEEEMLATCKRNVEKRFSGLQFRSMRKAIEVITKAFTADYKNIEMGASRERFLTELFYAQSGADALEKIRYHYAKIAPKIFEKEHEIFVSSLIEQTLPKDSLYADDLNKGYEHVKQHNPLPYSPVIGEDQLDAIEDSIKQEVQHISKNVEKEQREIVAHIKGLPLRFLPQELQQTRLRSGSDKSLLQAAYKAYRQGLFVDRETFDDLDDRLGECQIEETRLQMLTSARFHAQKSLQELKSLKQQRSEMVREDNAVLKAIEAKWMRESSRLKDCLERCQQTDHLKKLPENLKPHARKIIFLQNRLGLVLRDDQIQTLEEMIVNPALLKQLRMGLGKTSIILPFALEILASQGYNAIGMVPKALFTTNFHEMDTTTRVVFELAGNQFLFSRQDAPQPFSLPVLHRISKKCDDFFQALNRGEYLLTTVESKASLDDKINEVERSQAMIQGRLDELKEDDEKNPQIDRLFERVVDHQMVLDMLYRMKRTFEAPNTRLLIDEADQVARATYSVNTEMGMKETPIPLLRDTVSTIFSIIRDAPELDRLREQIDTNNQFTLTEEEVNGFIEMIGGIWLKKQGVPRDLDQKAICKWLAGGPSPFHYRDIAALGPFSQQLKAMRKALNSSLRASLKLKIGLSGAYDPIHQAVGVPASQGITSKTTKYSDPLMQLCLTHMIARNRPQGEAFLKSTAVDVYEQMKREHDEVGKEPITEEAIEKYDRLEEAIKKLGDLLERDKSGDSPTYSKELAGHNSVDIFLRQHFADQVALRKLIYVSESQISRPVQHALRGCHVIGLTGTATRNTEHVIKSSGHEKGMDSIEASGRESTAEVIYRFAKALPEGLQTPVETYSLNPKKALEQFQEFAKKGSGINFLVNQAGACDHLSLRDIAKALHQAGGRPIIFLDIDEEGKSAKSVYLNGRLEKLNSPALSGDDKRAINEQGFYYYHTPHVRGTHFDIPTGSRGKLLLSPTVNANDRDQAAYRARELGEGHVVEPLISEKQQDELWQQIGKTPTLGDIFKAHHRQTQQDEATEDLAAYQLHLNGILALAADQCKEEIQLNVEGRAMGDWLQSESRGRHIDEISGKAKIFGIFKKFFVQESGQEAYVRQLDREMTRGGERPTKEHLIALIDGQVRHAEQLLKILEEEKSKAREKGNRDLFSMIDTAERAINGALAALNKEKNIIEEKWSRLQKQYPQTVSATPNTQETAETEAEGEAEEEQETTSETASEIQRKQRGQATKGILTTLDQDLLDSIESSFEKRTLVIEDKQWYINGPQAPKKRGEETLESALAPVSVLWKRGTFISNRLDFKIRNATGGDLPELGFIIIEEDGQPLITAADAWEVNHATSADARILDGKSQHLVPAYTVKVTFDREGCLKLIYGASPSLIQGSRETFKANRNLQAEILFSLMHLGFSYSQLSKDQLRNVEDYWFSLTKKEQRELKTSLEECLKTKNPTSLQCLSQHLWASQHAEAA